MSTDGGGPSAGNLNIIEKAFLRRNINKHHNSNTR